MKTHINYFLLILFGFSFGVTFSHFQNNHHPRPPHFGEKNGPKDPSEHFVERLTRHLELNKDQEDKALAVFKLQHEELENIRRQTVPQFEEIRELTRLGIRNLLNTKQQSLFDSMQKDKEAGAPHFGGPMPRP